MTIRIRDADVTDHDPIVELALKIWAPVFASVNAELGPELAVRLHGEDWRVHQAADVRRILATDGGATWVAEEDGALLAFAAAAVVDPDRAIGEVQIVGVSPGARRRRVGADLVERASDWLQEHGMRVVYLSTGGDEGHASARALYNALGFTPFTNVQYFRVLEG